MAKRVPLYERLPEIYRIRDEEQAPPLQLRAYLKVFEEAFGAVHANIEALYHDLFIETCEDWVVPYIGDLMGTSHLAGDPWTLRADVADTIALRRRKGTLGAIELLTHDLTGWGVHCVELRENMVWHQHLNHQRPDRGGIPPFGMPGVTRHTPIRGGTVTVRDPDMLSLLGTPFDPFGHTADVKSPATGGIRYNLPNLAIFLWRLKAFQIPFTRPAIRPAVAKAGAVLPDARFVVRVDVNPTAEPVRLFNTYRFDPDLRPPVLTTVDRTPGPMPEARLTTGSEAGNPGEYVSVEIYNPADPLLSDLDVGEVGLQLHVPGVTFPVALNTWTFRGANLCAWEDGIRPPLRNREIAIDPEIGRVAIGVATAAEANALEQSLLMTYTYGAVGPVGSHPISRDPAPATWKGEATTIRRVNFHQNPNGLQQALDNIQNLNAPLVIEIEDSMVHALDLNAVAGAVNEAGGFNLRLNRSLIIRAASGQRPIVRLRRPLRFRPTNVLGATPAQQEQFDAINRNLTVRLEGLYITRTANFQAGAPLIARTALNSLEVIGCTLDPGGFRRLDGTRAPIRNGAALVAPYGFPAVEEAAFKETPAILVQRSIAGPLLIDADYTLDLRDSIVDAGAGVSDPPGVAFAVSSATNPAAAWGPPTTLYGVTFFGRMRVESIEGRGGIWVHQLEVHNNQIGCLKFCYFSGEADRLPQNVGCVSAPDALLRFTSETFGSPAYGQLAAATDFRIRERGPGDDQMGAFGFQLDAHRFRNLQIRYREFMPIGIRPLLIPVT
jgi:hypothetical protein